jgi:hypothetical protein
VVINDVELRSPAASSPLLTCRLEGKQAAAAAAAAAVLLGLSIMVMIG